MLTAIDKRRELALFKTKKEAISFAVSYFSSLASKIIKKKGSFYVVIPGGKTPLPFFKKLSKEKIDWSKIFIFFSDERVDLSNYHMAISSGLPKQNLFKMEADKNISQNARRYEKSIIELVGKELFDLVILGVGEDGHTASLFAKTKALQSKRLVEANFIPLLNSRRMTITLKCINESKRICFFAPGDKKRPILEKVLSSSKKYPASLVGTKTNKALWIASNKKPWA